MSQWTHINAVIRFDALRMILGEDKPDLGNTFNYESSDEECEKVSVPYGSEGSLQHQLWENPSRSAMAAYTAMFWGDLRDYSNLDEILSYFNKLTTGKLIRSGILEIDVEGSPTKIYRCDGYNDGKWIEIYSEMPKD